MKRKELKVGRFQYEEDTTLKAVTRLITHDAVPCTKDLIKLIKKNKMVGVLFDVVLVPVEG